MVDVTKKLMVGTMIINPIDDNGVTAIYIPYEFADLSKPEAKQLAEYLLESIKE